MFAVMNKKWWKLGLTLGGFVIFVYLLADLFLLESGAKKRYLLDKKATIENFKKNEKRFNEIKFLSDSLPFFNFNLSKSDSVFLDLNFENHHFSSYEEYNNSIKIILDTFSNQKNWIVKTNDSTFIQSQKRVEEHFNQFEKISQLVKQVDCQRISNKNDLNIYYKTFHSTGFRYSFYYSNSSQNSRNEEFFIEKKLNEYFYWNFYDESLINFIHPHWIYPDSEFK